MKTYRIASAPMLVALGAGLLTVSSCGKKATISPLPNQRPTVRLTSAPLNPVTRYKYLITLNWIGFDPDGRVDRFIFAIDAPTDPGSDTLWETTTRNQVTRSFESADSLESPNFSQYHTFAIKAVDNRGALSEPQYRAFTSFTVAPNVQVLSPAPSALIRRYVTPAVLIRWDGTDPDGVFTQKPVKYKYKLLSSLTEVTEATAKSDPDSVRRYYAPRNWAGWDSTTADTTQKQFINLIPNQRYMFCVIAFDEAGAYSPFFNLQTNMLHFQVTFAGANNPTIGFFNSFFAYEYPQGMYQPNNPATEIPLEVPAGRPGHAEDKLTINWYAHPIEGSAIRSYRWAVDIVDLNDETQRSDDETDLAHWSQKSDLVTSARIGPYPGGETHKFYLEAEDINGLKSLGVIRFNVVQATFDKELGIVDDTRLILDRVSTGTSCDAPVNRPIQRWPTAAELDTFLYARGGVPWRCYPPVNGQTQLSPPGLFNGYEFDTLGTLVGLNDMTTRLSRLGRFRHLIWLTDGKAASNDRPGTDYRNGAITSMRYMNDLGRANNVAAYIRQGGLVWLAGGGTATAALANFNKSNNDTQQPMPYKTWSFTNGELVPGRFIYDQAHWRSEFKQLRAKVSITRYLGRFENNPGIYQFLPTAMQPKTAQTDPFPPNRAVNPGDFYQTDLDIEVLTLPNEVLEDQDPDPPEDFQSTLDTLFVAAGAVLQPLARPPLIVWPVMTYYRGTGAPPTLPAAEIQGFENTPLILTGFNIWNFRRTQCKALVDFVLQKLWDIQPTQAATSYSVRAPAGDFASAGWRPWSPPAGRAARAQRAPGSQAASPAAGSRD